MYISLQFDEETGDEREKKMMIGFKHYADCKEFDVYYVCEILLLYKMIW